MKRRIKLLIEYDGKPFSGWQRQSGAGSIQGEIERGLSEVLRHAVTLHGAGRTDAGVHALGMTAHFDTPNPMPAAKLPRALSAILPDAISVVEAEEAAPDFHARRDATLRWYRYQIEVARERRPLGPRSWRIPFELDFEAMREAVSRLEGDHDFSGFRSVKCSAERTQLTMREARLERQGRLFIADFKCPSFLQRQVRLMIGSVVGVGLHRLAMAEFMDILHLKRRRDTVKSAPADGLCLMRIAYSEAEAENLLTEHPPGPSF